jgi:hypothetical protein
MTPVVRRAARSDRQLIGSNRSEPGAPILPRSGQLPGAGSLRIQPEIFQVGVNAFLKIQRVLNQSLQIVALLG